jgi:hypothetical protein
MTAVASRRRSKDGETEQLRAELAEARAEVAELRQVLKAVAGLAFGIGVSRAPVGGSVRNVREVCNLYGVSSHAETIQRLFEG